MKAPVVSAECYFLDVGQGTSNVILLGERRAIMVDCGRSAAVPMQLLRRYVDQIVALIVSHNDIDHHGGASQIIAAYPKAIDRVYFLQDRPMEQLHMYALARSEYEAGNLVNPPLRLEREDHPRVIYEDPKAALSLELFFPTFLDNLDAQRAVAPNATSAVLILFLRLPADCLPGRCYHRRLAPDSHPAGGGNLGRHRGCAAPRRQTLGEAGRRRIPGRL